MSLPAIPNQIGNRLLNRLSKEEYNFLVRSEKSVSLAHGDEVYQEDSRGGLSHVYFPTSGMISLTVLMEDGKEVEAGTVGNEGMVGLSVAHGLDFSPTKAISQISGDGLRIPVSAFLKAMKRGGTLETLMRRYTAFSLRYANQTLACNLLHSAEQRMCRWLLMCRDRVEHGRLRADPSVPGRDARRSPPDCHCNRRDAAIGERHYLSSGRHPYSQSEKAGSRQLRMLRGHQGVLRPHHAVTRRGCPISDGGGRGRAATLRVSFSYVWETQPLGVARAIRSGAVDRDSPRDGR